MIERMRLKNFRAFRDVEIKDVPQFAVVVGANGTGKSTLFSVFGFLKDAMASNVNTALSKLGGGRGFREVRSRNADGPIMIEVTFRPGPRDKLTTYTLEVDEDAKGGALVKREILERGRGGKGRPRRLLDFSNGEGYAVADEADEAESENNLRRERQRLKSPDILAAKGLAQFERFPAAVALGDLIERWRLSDFHIGKARSDQGTGHAEHLSREGENLALVAQHLQKQHPNTFKKALDRFSERVPGMSDVQTTRAEDGRVLIKFRDGAFEDPFLAPFASDGTIKMLAYLFLLRDPRPHPLLCVEEPENHLYPALLPEIAEEFRDYAHRREQGGQVLVSTHSPTFLNAVKLDEVFWLKKKDGATAIERAKDNGMVVRQMNEGALMGDLWTEGFFQGAHPRDGKGQVKSCGYKKQRNASPEKGMPSATTVRKRTFGGMK